MPLPERYLCYRQSNSNTTAILIVLNRKTTNWNRQIKVVGKVSIALLIKFYWFALCLESLAIFLLYYIDLLDMFGLIDLSLSIVCSCRFVLKYFLFLNEIASTFLEGEIMRRVILALLWYTAFVGGERSRYSKCLDLGGCCQGSPQNSKIFNLNNWRKHVMGCLVAHQMNRLQQEVRTINNNQQRQFFFFDQQSKFL